MSKALLLSLCYCLLLAGNAFARPYTEEEARDVWNTLRKKPVTEENFRAVCDLAQEVGQSDINLYYEIITTYLPIVEKTGDRRRVHILLMTLAKTKVALGLYEEAETLYQRIHENAGDSASFLRTSLVGTVILYSEWDKHPDSLTKYFPIAERQFIKTNDREALSFIYTFKALSLLNQPDAVRGYLEKAIRLATDLPDKNALFTARYNYALAVLQNNPQQQIIEFEQLLELAKDSSLVPNAKLYSGRLYSFGLAAMSVYYQLTQLNLLLTDYENAGKYGQTFYDMTIRRYPHGADVPYLSAELSIVKSYQGRYAEARSYLDTSLSRFKMPEDSIPYAGYFVAAGMLAEHDGQQGKALGYFEKAHKMGNETYGLLLMPPGINYAHALVLNNRIKDAAKIFSEFGPDIKAREYTALGYYYYKYYAEFLKARQDYPGYTAALETFYGIKDSLAGLNQYRAIREIETKMSVREKEAQISRLDGENATKLRDLRKDRIYFILLASLSAIIFLLLAAYTRNRYQRLQKQHRIDVMQGIIDAEENERRKIADQLHDDVGAMLALASLNISAVLEKDAPPEPATEKLQKALEVLGDVSGNVRDLSHRLTPLVIEKYGFRKSVEDMVYTANLSGKLHMELIIVGFDDSREYPLPFLNDLYRILQELLHNILKHAQATTALLEIVEHETALSIMVEDNGLGLTTPSEQGMGLKAIRAKIAYLNGTIDISSTMAGGAMTGSTMAGGTLIIMDIPTYAP
jgi:signal transduction histidine kinase